jgi:protein subunit release factor B
MYVPFPVDLPPPSLALAAELGLNPEDVEEQFTRGTGKGGQKMNKTSSVVHLKHRPTGIEVKVQRHREQSKNRLSAWKLLVLKLEEQVKGKESKRAKAIFKIKKQKQRRSRKAKEKMLVEKHHRAAIKDDRKPMR